MSWAYFNAMQTLGGNVTVTAAALVMTIPMISAIANVKRYSRFKCYYPVKKCETPY